MRYDPTVTTVRRPMRWNREFVADVVLEPVASTPAELTATVRLANPRVVRRRRRRGTPR